MLGLCGGLPLATPANKLPASLPAPTESPLRVLDHPWPHGKGPTPTRARPCMMLLVEIRKGFLEAAERVLVPDERDLVLLLVEDVILVVGLRRRLLDALCRTGRLGSQVRFEEASGAVVGWHARWLRRVPVTLLIVTARPAAVTWDLRVTLLGPKDHAAVARGVMLPITEPLFSAVSHLKTRISR